MAHIDTNHVPILMETEVSAGMGNQVLVCNTQLSQKRRLTRTTGADSDLGIKSVVV